MSGKATDSVAISMMCLNCSRKNLVLVEVLMEQVVVDILNRSSFMINLKA